MLRVLMVTPLYAPSVGGVETHVAQVAERLAGTCVEVTVLTTDALGNLPSSEQLRGVTVERVPAWPRNRDYLFAPHIYQRIIGGRWDVVHCQSYHTCVAPLSMLAAQQAGIPYVVTFHAGGHSSHLRNTLRGPQWALLRPLLARAERLITIAHFETERYSRRLNLPSERFVCIPNGCDALTPPSPLSNQRPSSGPIIASVGRLERYKGHHLALAAMPYVLQQQPNAELHIIGAGPFEAQLRRMVDQLSLRDHVVIAAIPYQDRQRMARLLSDSNLVVLLSAYETHPIAAIEAAALGRSLLVADTPGLRELATRGLARVAPGHNRPRQLAAAMLEQLRRPLVPQTADLPRWDDCAAALQRLYHEVASGHVSDR